MGLVPFTCIPWKAHTMSKFQMIAADAHGSIAVMPINTAFGDTLAAAQDSAIAWLNYYDHGFDQAYISSRDITGIPTSILWATVQNIGPEMWLIDTAEFDTPEESLEFPARIPSDWVDEIMAMPEPEISFYCGDCNRFTDHVYCDPTAMD
jgi:hypothetical protein